MTTAYRRLVRGQISVIFCGTLAVWALAGGMSAGGEQPAKQLRQRPRILVPDEFRVAVVKGQFPALQFVFDDVDGKPVITHILTFKANGGGKTGSGNKFRRFDPPHDRIRMSKPRNKLEFVPVDKLGGAKPVIGVLPARVAIIAASFPYKQQVEEFQRALHLKDHRAVLKEQVHGEKGKTWPSFQFEGVEVERMTLNADGSDGKWEPLDVATAYKEFLIVTNRSVEKDKTEYTPILQASRGLVMSIPAQLPEDLRKPEPSAERKAPDLVRRLKNLQKTLEKLASKDRKDTPIEHCLLRFVDVTVEAGQSYRYRLRVQMLNPNYAPDPKKRKDTTPELARNRVLKSEWVCVPQVVADTPDQFVYVLDLPDTGLRLNTVMRRLEPWRWNLPPLPPRQRPSQVAVQIHRWVDFYDDDPGKRSRRIKAVGEWLVAVRVLVERGEYIRDADYRVPVPIKPTDLFEHELDTNPKPQRGEDNRLMHVAFGDESVLVDFEGELVRYKKSEGSGKNARMVSLREDSAVQLLIMRPDGKMIARNSADDGNDRERLRRSEAFIDRIERLRARTRP